MASAWIDLPAGDLLAFPDPAGDFFACPDPAGLDALLLAVDWPPLDADLLLHHPSASSSATPDSSCAPSPAASSPPPPPRRGPPVASGRVAKRKPRASKRTPVTYIEANPANFREMVQQITGIQIGAAPPPPPPARSDAPRAALAPPQGYLPTLDTSAPFLDRPLPVPAPAPASADGFPSPDSWWYPEFGF